MSNQTPIDPVTVDLELRGRSIRADEGGLISLLDIWHAAGSTVTQRQRPGEWRRLPTTQKLIEALLLQNTGKSRNWTESEVSAAIYQKQGRYGGSFADARLALAYAEYLSPKLALEVKEVFLRFKAADARLADDILDRASPEANEWAGRRALGRAVRKGYTATLAAHGVDKPLDFALCTNATYQGLFDKNAKQLKAQKGVKGSLRDAMDLRELAYIMASEALSSESIEEANMVGASACRTATARSARHIRDAIAAERRDRQIT